MNTPYHQKPIEAAFLSRSKNLYGRSINSLRAQLGVRARLHRFEAVKAVQTALWSGRAPQLELAVVDYPVLSENEGLPQFSLSGGGNLPALLLLRKSEMSAAEAALEAGYKALLFVDSDREFRQMFPAMVLRIVTYYRAEMQRAELFGNPATAAASELGMSEEALRPLPLMHRN